LKEKIIAAVESIRGEIVELSHKIHENPETGYQEFRASAWQKELLGKYGFEITAPFCGMETSYLASYASKKPGPSMAFLAEYDCLMGSHICGHNTIAGGSVGAGIALSRFVNETGGRVCVVGAPAEEGGGGKIKIVDEGGLEGIDYAMMMHPRFQTMIRRPPLMATAHVEVEYFGKTTHPSKYQSGINALTSLISLFNAVDAKRPSWPEKSTVLGVILEGGRAANVMPDYTKGLFDIRSTKKSEVLDMIEDFKRLAQAAADVTGARTEATVGLVYSDSHLNGTMADQLRVNLEALGETVVIGDPNEKTGASDIANVSEIVPTAHEYIFLVNASAHTEPFREAARSRRGDEVVALMAKAMAMTGYDILTDPILRDQIQKEFSASVA
jgi:amidohydrolase